MYSGQTSSNVDNIDNKLMITSNSNNSSNNNLKLSNNSSDIVDEYHQLHEQQLNLHEHKPKLSDRIEWSRDKILGFIEDYRRERVLWDPNCRGYHIKQIKYEALKALGLKYGAEIRAIRSKIKSLRSSFHREHGKVINGQRKGVHYQPVWFAYEAIRFILDENFPTNVIQQNNEQLIQQPQQQQQQQQELKEETLSESLQNVTLAATTTTTTNTTTTTASLITTTTATTTISTTNTTMISSTSGRKSDKCKNTATEISTLFTNNNNNNNSNINNNWSLPKLFRPKPELQRSKNDYSSNSDNYSNNNSDTEEVDSVAFFTAAAMAAVSAAVASAGSSITDKNTPINFFDNQEAHNWIIRAEDIKTEILSNDGDECGKNNSVNADMTTLNEMNNYNKNSCKINTNQNNNNKLNEENTTIIKQRICNNLRKRKHVTTANNEGATTKQPLRSNRNKNTRSSTKLPAIAHEIKCLDSSSQTDTTTYAVSAATTTGPATTTADEHSIFGDYVAITIRKLKTAKAKIVVKHIINNVLYEAEMGKYDLGMPASTDPPQLYKM